LSKVRFEAVWNLLVRNSAPLFDQFVGEVGIYEGL